MRRKRGKDSRFPQVGGKEFGGEAWGTRRKDLGGTGQVDRRIHGKVQEFTRPYGEEWDQAEAAPRVPKGQRCVEYVVGRNPRVCTINGRRLAGRSTEDRRHATVFVTSARVPYSGIWHAQHGQFEDHKRQILGVKMANGTWEGPGLARSLQATIR